MNEVQRAMISTTEILGGLSVALVALFLAITAVLFGYTLFSRCRLRRVILTWRRGPVPGFPLWPTAFLLGVMAFLVYIIGAGLTLNPFVVTGYLVGGSLWFAASVLSQSVVVTDYAIMRNPANPSKALPWGQIVDYFVKPSRSGSRYVFFYHAASGQRKRMDIKVPHYVQILFQRIVSSKLDARFDYTVEQTYGRKALND